MKILTLRLILLSILAPSLGWSQQKEPLLDKSKLLKLKNEQQLQIIEAKIKRTLILPVESSKDIKTQEVRLKEMLQNRQELLLRRSFLSQLMAQIATKFKGTENIKSFLSQVIHNMSYQEAIRSNANSQFWKFLSYLGSALKSQQINNEDPITFVESFMITSSISNPTPPHKFFSDRHYTNGVKNVMAKDLSKETVGDSIDDQLQALDIKNNGVSHLKLSKKDLLPHYTLPLKK